MKSSLSTVDSLLESLLKYCLCPNPGENQVIYVYRLVLGQCQNNTGSVSELSVYFFVSRLTGLQRGAWLWGCHWLRPGKRLVKTELRRKPRPWTGARGTNCSATCKHHHHHHHRHHSAPPSGGESRDIISLGSLDLVVTLKTQTVLSEHFKVLYSTVLFDDFIVLI